MLREGLAAGDTGPSRRRSPRQRAAFLAAVLAITALGGLLRFQSLDYGLPHWGTRPDELPIIQQTRLPASGEFDLGWSIYPPAYVYTCWIWAEAVFGVGRVLGRVPAEDDYLALLRKDRASVFLVVRAFSALMGTLCVFLLVMLARRHLGYGEALCAGVFLATCLLHVRDSHTLKPDVLLSLWIVVALAAMVPLARRATLLGGCLAGAAVGGAMAAKYPGAVLLAPLYLAAVVGSSQRGWRRLVPAPALAGGLTTAAVFLVTSPFLIFDRDSMEYLITMARVVFPQEVLDTIVPVPESRAALPQLDAPSPGWRTLGYHLRYSFWYGLGPLGALLAPLALGWGLSRRNPALWLPGVFFLVWFVVASLSPHQYTRYLTPAVSMLLLLEAAFLVAITRRLPRRRANVALALACLAVAGPPLWNSLQFVRLAGRTDTRVLATEWMAEYLPRGEAVAVVGTVFWPWGAPELPRGVPHASLPSPGPPDVASLEHAGVKYLVTHDHDQLRWSTVPHEWLETLAPRLDQLARFDPWRSSQGQGAVFEGADAYYIPLHGFSALTRPGPVIRIYDFR